MIRLVDRQARETAVTAFDRNLIVVAGAGTGKTSLLVERVLNAVALGVARIHEIAAITFTEKAAAELRERIAAGLETLRILAADADRAGGSDEARRVFARLTAGAALDRAVLTRRMLEALDRLDSARITTIHGFCAELLRDRAVEAGVDPDFRVDAGIEGLTLLDEEWTAFLAREFAESGRRHALWAALLDRVTLGEIKAPTIALCRAATPEALFHPGSLSSAQEIFGERASTLVGRILQLLDRETSLRPKLANNLRAAAGALSALAREGSSAFQAACSRTGLDQPKNLEDLAEDPGKKVAEANRAEAIAIGDATRSLVRSLLTVDEVLARLFVEAIGPFVRVARERLLARGLIGFDALLVQARDLLRDHTEARAIVKRRFRLLLVDEFQDTDPTQYEIVLLLGECEELSAPDPWQTLLAPGKLFVVGDPKQSIYRFRGADYDALRQALDRIGAQGAEELTLQANFRSHEAIVNAVNALFEEPQTAVWRTSDYQPRYVPIRATIEAQSDLPRVEVWTIPETLASAAGDRRELEARVIADAIAREVGASGGSRPSDYAILLRAFSEVSIYLRALREREIPFVVDGGREFLERREIIEAFALLRAVAQPSDSVALLAFLRSPAGAVPDDELARWATKRRPWHRNETVDASEFPAIERAFALLGRLVRETSAQPAATALARIVEGAGLPALAAAAYEGAQRVANLEKLVTTAAAIGLDGRLSLPDLIEAIGPASGSPDGEGSSPLADDRDDAVRVMTVHKMKGLEARQVFLADLSRDRHRYSGAPPPRVLRLPTRGSELAFRIGGRASPAQAWLRMENELHEAAEEVRLFYVAATRACDRLVLLVGKSRDSIAIEALAAWDYRPGDLPEDGARIAGGRALHRLVAVPASAGSAADREIRRETAAVDAWSRVLDRARSYPSPSPRAPSEAPSEVESLHEAAGAPAVRRGERDLGRTVGEIVHRWLERGGSAPDDAPALLFATCHAAAQRTGVATTRLASEVREVLDAFVRSPLAQRLAEVEVLGRELPVSFRDAKGALWHGTVDLLYRDRSGATVVADYKTDRELADEWFLARYGRQLSLYTRAIERALGLAAPARAELWLLRCGRVVEIPTP